MPSRFIAEYTDSAAGFLRSGNWAGNGLVSGPLIAALQAASNANLGTVTYGLATIGTTPASSAPYPLVIDTAVLNFVTSVGSPVRVVIPSPVAAIFGTGGDVVDPTNALVLAVIAAVTGFLGDAGGNLVTTYLQGAKASRRVEQNG